MYALRIVTKRVTIDHKFSKDTICQCLGLVEVLAPEEEKRGVYFESATL